MASGHEPHTISEHDGIHLAVSGPARELARITGSLEDALVRPLRGSPWPIPGSPIAPPTEDADRSRRRPNRPSTSWPDKESVLWGRPSSKLPRSGRLP